MSHGLFIKADLLTLISEQSQSARSILLAPHMWPSHLNGHVRKERGEG